MKHLLTILLTCFLLQAQATNYFVKETGNNSSAGTSDAAAWSSLTKVNNFTYAASGDTVKFNRGNTFYGVLKPKSGVVYDYYGTGAIPVITGLVTATGWVNDGGGIWYVPAPAAKSNLNIVVVNNAPVSMGRTPNANSTAAGVSPGGYYNYETVNSISSISDNQLTATPDWTGAQVYIRENRWSGDRSWIAGHTVTTLNLKPGKNFNGQYPAKVFLPTKNYGYIFFNHKRTLDQLTEWFLDTTTQRLYMYFGADNPNSYNVQYSSIDTGCDMATKSNIRINNLAFTGFHRGVYNFYGNGITINNCNFTYCTYGVQAFGVTNLVIDGGTITDILSTGISNYSTGKTNSIIQNLTITRCGIIPGMGAMFSESDISGIFCGVKDNALIKNCNISYTGNAGIYCGGNNVTVENCVIKYCNSVCDDRANIYTMDEVGNEKLNTIFRNNVLAYSIGAPNGTNSTEAYGALLYLDFAKANVLIENNTIYESSRNGIHSSNANNVRMQGNTIWNCKRPVSIYRWTWSDIQQLYITNNVIMQFNPYNPIFPYGNQGLNDPNETTLQQVFTAAGYYDSNYYYHAPAAGYTFAVSPNTGVKQTALSSLNFTTWKAFTGYDAHSTSIGLLPTYTLKTIIGSTKTTNGTFTSNITGWSRAGSGTLTWDAGRLKITIPAPVPNTNTLTHSPVGTVTLGKKYIARVTITGSNSNGICTLYLRRTASPNTIITETLLLPYNSGTSVKEVLLQPNATAAASIVVSIEQGSGNSFIDNVMLYEAEATVLNPQSSLRFEVNETGAAKNVTLTDGTYVDFTTGATVTSFTLAAGGSRIFRKISSGTTGGSTGTNTTTGSKSAAVLFFNK